MMTERLKVNKYDSLMTQQNFERFGEWSMCYTIKPQKIQWVYGGGCMPEALEPMHRLDEEGIDVTLFTDKDILSPMVDMVETKYKVVYLSECRSVHPFAYRNILMAEDKFDLILTHDEDLLKRGPKYVKNRLGGTWIDDSEAGITKKTKLCSHMVSNKLMCRGHRLRHIIAKAIKGRYDKVDLLGHAFQPFESKADVLKDYMFTFCIMNAKHNNYWTETVQDAFRMGVVPIFWGCPNIGEYFNEKGILSFNTGPELFEILDSLSEQKYQDMLEYVYENYEIAKNYLCPDDQIAENLINILGLESHE